MKSIPNELERTNPEPKLYQGFQIKLVLEAAIDPEILTVTNGSLYFPLSCFAHMKSFSVKPVGSSP